MKNSILTFATLALVLFMSSCAKDEVADRNGSLDPIKFRISLGKTTRANANEISSMTGKVITIYAVDGSGGPVDMNPNESATQSVFYMKWNGTSATTFSDYACTDPTYYYFPTDGSTVNFFAISQTDDADTEIPLSGFTATAATIDDYVNDIERDVVTAYTTGDVTTTTITFTFEHIVSQLVFQASTDDSNLRINITRLAMNTYESGDCALDGPETNGMATWTLTAPTSETVLYNNSTTPVSSATENDPQLIAQAMILPHSTSDITGASFEVDYTIEDISAPLSPIQIETGTKTVNLGTFISEHTSAIDSWNASTRYYYVFKPVRNFSSRVVDIILSPWLEDTSGNSPDDIYPSVDGEE